MLTDQPVLDSRDDALERKDFAKQLAKTLVLQEGSPSIVVGLEGAYGSGKTTLINFVKAELGRCKPKPIIVEYNPWLLASLDSTIEGFFVELAAAVGTSSKAINAKAAGRKVLHYAKMLAPIKLIPGVEPWGTIVQSVMTSVGSAAQAGAELADLSLLKRKRDLEASLTKLGRPIVVIIDDTDRLPPEEMRIVFQMLKAVSDFKRTSYLVAHDAEVVARALSYKGQYDGLAYLEKLIQIKVQIPRFGITHRRALLVSMLDNHLSGAVTPQERSLIDQLLDGTDLLRALSTPRDLTRLVNMASFITQNLANEVCAADVIAFAALQLKFPEVTDLIKANPESYITALASDNEMYSQTLTNEVNVGLDLDQNGPRQSLYLSDNHTYTPKEASAVRSIVEFMFPKVAGDSSEGDSSRTLRRVCDREALVKLLHCGVTSVALSISEARDFLERPERREQIFASWVDDDIEIRYIYYFTDLISSVQETQPIELIEFLCASVHDYPPSKPPSPLVNSVRRAAETILLSLHSNSDRINCLLRLLSSCTSLCVSSGVLTTCLQNAGYLRDGEFDPKAQQTVGPTGNWDWLSPELAKKAVAQFLNTARKSACEGHLVGHQKFPNWTLALWGVLAENGPEEPIDYVGKHMSDPEWLREFVYWHFPNSPRPDYAPVEIAGHIRRLDPAPPHAKTLADAWQESSHATDEDTPKGSTSDTPT